ncbi:MAG: hypothetical protein JL50_07240 [Peptococcaceae bacterium BICA1-7]|jgi:hypothetical protein|nr:MAG: hypothetical protein JL50_07240 [Peptococcaceae bacterium BICA1-7]HBV99139.1 hypothetical protein [Desulfotomaculum sp.]
MIETGFLNDHNKDSKGINQAKYKGIIRENPYILRQFTDVKYIGGDIGVLCQFGSFLFCDENTKGGKKS